MLIGSKLVAVSVHVDKYLWTTSNWLVPFVGQLRHFQDLTQSLSIIDIWQRLILALVSRKHGSGVRVEGWRLTNLFKKCLIICQHCRIICHIVMINEWNVSLTHWCHGIMGKGCRTNLPPWLPSKQIPHNPQMEQVDDFVTSIYQHAHLLGGTQVSRNHGWGLMERSTRRALALQVVLFCPNLWKLPNNMLKIAY